MVPMVEDDTARKFVRNDLLEVGYAHVLLHAHQLARGLQRHHLAVIGMREPDTLRIGRRGREEPVEETDDRRANPAQPVGTGTGGDVKTGKAHVEPAVNLFGQWIARDAPGFLPELAGGEGLGMAEITLV